MKKFKAIALGVATILLITSSRTLYVKNVQAKSMIESYKTSLSGSNYEEALAIQNKASNDIIIEKLYGFSKNTKTYAETEYYNVKNNYLSDEITYDDLISSISQLEALNDFKLSSEEKQNMQAMEGLREKYRNAEDSFSKDDYASSNSILNDIEDKLDENYKAKAAELRVSISDKVKAALEDSIDKFLVIGNYTDALKALEAKKALISSQLYSEKLKEINDFKNNKLKMEEAKKKAAEEQKKKAAEEARKKEDAKLAIYLNDYTPNPSKEAVVQNFSSRTKFLVWVDIPSQTTNIFVGSKGNWKLIKSFLSSTGRAGAETPRGTFTIKDRGKWFFSEKYQQGGKNWVRIFGNYLFHSLPMNRNQQIVDYTLGTAASHGCIRLSLDNILWFYNNISSGTTVYIK